MTSDSNHLIASRLCRRDPASSRRLLDEVSVSVGPDQRVALAGPSGSGKTLLLRALAKLDPLDSGLVRWQGREIGHSEIPAFRAAVMLVPQQPAISVGTVEDQLRMPYRFRLHRHAGRSFDRDAAIARLVTTGRNASFLSQPAQRLSGGERQMLALLRAIQLQPQILLLDEPTSAMDAPSAAVAESWIADWFSADPTRSYLWVSHDEAQRQRVADVRWILESGKVHER